MYYPGKIFRYLAVTFEKRSFPDYFGYNLSRGKYMEMMKGSPIH